MIEIVNLNKIYNYKKPNEFQALKDVSLTIKDGEMVAIMGTSGAGKSTLMHIIGCIDNFESGEYRLNGNDMRGLSESKRAMIRNQEIGIVMQDFVLIEEYTVLENVMVPLYFSKGKKHKRRIALEALKSIGIEELANKTVNKLSGGQKQRVAIARAIVNEPSIILADEPTGALDSKTAGDIMQVFSSLNQMGKTVIIITHDSHVAQQCQRIVTISDGEIQNIN